MPSPDSPPTPPWGRIALSAVLPMAGLLGLAKVPAARRKALATMAFVLAAQAVLWLLHVIASWMPGEPMAATIVRAVRVFVVLSGGVFGAVYTHDAWARTVEPTVRPWFFSGDASSVANDPNV